MYAPLFLKNYALGVLEVDLRVVLLAGLVSGTPFAAMWSYVGTSAHSVVGILEGRHNKSPGRSVPPSYAALAAIVFLPLGAYVVSWVKKEWKKASLELKEKDDDKRLAKDK